MEVIKMDWFKYVWIVLLGIIWIIWTVESVKDLNEYVNDCKHHRNDITEYGVVAAFWMVFHFLALFIGSFIYFLLHIG